VVIGYWLLGNGKWKMVNGKWLMGKGKIVNRKGLLEKLLKENSWRKMVDRQLLKAIVC